MNPPGRATTPRSLFVLPSLFVGLGGFSKPVFPRLDARFQEHYGGARPESLPMVIFDFDEASSEVVIEGRSVSIQPYLVNLPKKPLLEVARHIRRRGGKLPEHMQALAGYVDPKFVRAIEAPGLNLLPQNGNLAWRLAWQTHVLPALETRIRRLHADPRTRSRLEEQGIRVSDRSAVWVVAGGGSTTGPTGLVPALCELKRLLPPETSLFAMVFTPRSYRDKTDQHRGKGRAIFRATMEVLTSLFGERIFDQPYGTDGYRISTGDDPFDHLVLMDGTLDGGRTEMNTEEMAELVALGLFKLSTSALGEQFLGIGGNLHRGGIQS